MRRPGHHRPPPLGILKEEHQPNHPQQVPNIPLIPGMQKEVVPLVRVIGEINDGKILKRTKTVGLLDLYKVLQHCIKKLFPSMIIYLTELA